jgi:molybdopterin molybdotransferase
VLPGRGASRAFSIYNHRVPEIVLTFLEARAQVEALARDRVHPGIEEVPLLAAHGRVLAEDVAADRPYPPFDRAARDGYAVRATDLANVPAKLKLAGSVKAGVFPNHQLHSGECIEIMTGAPVPPGADAVVMVEHTTRTDDLIEFQRMAAVGDNFVPTGSEAAAGSRVLQTGTRLEHAQIAVAAAVGKSELRVYRLPRIAILPTGDEIVEVAAMPGPAHIRNSNSYSLAAQVAAAGAVPVQLPIAPDRHEELRELITQGLESDLLLLSGGVSMGKYDLVEEILHDFHAEFFFTGAKIQPGKPIVCGRVQSKLFLGLPGNPISTMVTFDLFARPLIDALSGALPASLRFTQAKLEKDFRTKLGLTRFLPAKLGGDIAEPRVAVVPWQGSGDIFSAAKADCYLVVPPDRDELAAGEMVTVLLP